jgi:hypothetical protein
MIIMILTDDLAKNFVKYLYEINQDFKTLPDPFYFIEKGKVFSYNQENLSQCFASIKNLSEGKPLEDKKGKPNKKNQLNNNTFLEIKNIKDPFVIYGNDFFQFHKEYKKEINSVVIDSSGIKILTSLPRVDYVFKYVKDCDLEGKYYENSLKFFRNLVKNTKDSEEYFFEFSYEQFFEMKERKFSISLYLDCESNKVVLDKCNSDYKIPLKFAHKFFISFNKDTLCNFYVYPSKDDDNIYIVRINIDNKYYNCNQYMKIVEY